MKIFVLKNQNQVKPNKNQTKKQNQTTPTNQPTKSIKRMVKEKERDFLLPWFRVDTEEDLKLQEFLEQLDKISPST